MRDDIVERIPQTGGKKRGRPPKTNDNVKIVSDRKRSKQSVTKRLRWTDTSREEFDREQKRARNNASQDIASSSRDAWQQEFGSGEGGGVT